MSGLFLLHTARSSSPPQLLVIGRDIVDKPSGPCTSVKQYWRLLLAHPRACPNVHGGRTRSGLGVKREAEYVLQGTA